MYKIFSTAKIVVQYSVANIYCEIYALIYDKYILADMIHL